MLMNIINSLKAIEMKCDLLLVSMTNERRITSKSLKQDLLSRLHEPQYWKREWNKYHTEFLD